MVILGTGSDRDIYKALEQIKSRTMGQTHEVSKNTESRPKGFNPIAGEPSNEVREYLPQVVYEAD